MELLNIFDGVLSKNQLKKNGQNRIVNDSLEETVYSARKINPNVFASLAFPHIRTRHLLGLRTVTVFF